MLIWLQNEFISKLHIIVIFILLINQERVVVIKLLTKTMEKRKATRENKVDYYQYCLKTPHSLKHKKGICGEFRLQIGSKVAANKGHYQLKSVKLPKWRFLLTFLLSGAHMTESMVITDSRRATWEQRDTVADSCGPSEVFKWLAREVECYFGSGSQVGYRACQCWPYLFCLFSSHLLELTPDVHPARIIPSLCQSKQQAHV